MLTRRFFIKIMGFLGLGFVFQKVESMAFSGQELEFYVAGVRFLNSTPKLTTGDLVMIYAEKWEQEPCYVVCDTHDKKMGYIPKSIASIITKTEILNAHCVCCNSYSVPWKRYKIRIRLAT